MSNSNLPQPWLSFLHEIDEFLKEETYLHCLGGFVVTQVYGSQRSTSDLDALTLVQKDPQLFTFAGEGSRLHRRHSVYLDPVGIVTLPENYEDRLTEKYAVFHNLRIFVLDPYDLALAKIERNIERDRDDVKFLASTTPFDLEVMRLRYYEELRPYLANPEREDLTLRLWVEMIEEERAT